MDPQYKSYISANEFKNNKDVEVKEEPVEMTEEFLITEEYPDYFEAMDGGQEKHINDSSEASKVKNEECAEMEMTFYECEICKEGFTSNWEAKRHEELHAADETYHCQSCKISFMGREQLERHTRTRGEANPLLSKVENEQRAKIEKTVECEVNEKRAKVEETVECEMCKAKFTANCQAKRQETGHASDRSSLCQRCRIGLKRKEWLEKNKRTEEEASLKLSKLQNEKRAKIEETVECLMCKEKFTSNCHTKRREAGRASNTSPVCYGCRFSLKIKVHLGKNKGTDKEAEIQAEKRTRIRKTDECVICEIAFESSCKANLHKNVHSFEKPFRCHSCHVSFTGIHNLKNHMKIHKLVSDYRCNECSLQFPNGNERERNRAFRNYRINMCLYCGNKLKASGIGISGEEQVSERQQAFKAQNGELVKMKEKYDCWICQVKFKSDCEAKRHVNFHSNDNPFCCHSCCISFGGKRYNLHKHMQLHKLASRYRCKECSLQFTDFNEKDRDRAFRNYRIKMCLYCGDRLQIIEDKGSNSQPSSSNIGEDNNVLPSVHQGLSKLIPVETLPITSMDGGKGRAEYRIAIATHSNTAHQLPSHELEDLQKLRGEPSKTKPSEFLADENNSNDIKVLEGEQQEHLYENLEASNVRNETRADIEETFQCDIRVRTLPLCSLDGCGKGRAEYNGSNMTHSNTVHQLPSGELEDLQKLQGEPKQTKTGDVAIDENNSDDIEILDGEQQVQNEDRTKVTEVYKCEICCVTFKSIVEAKRHENVHTFDKPFYCHSCNSNFRKKYNLKNHMKSHKVVSQYRCKECSLQFTNGNDRDRHKAFRNYRIKMCLYCGKTFPGIEVNTEAFQPSSSNDGKDCNMLPSGHQHLSKLVRVRTLPITSMDGGKGRAEYKVMLTHTNTTHALSSRELGDSQKLQGEPKQSKTGDVVIDEANSEDIEILEGEQQAQSEDNTESNEIINCDICYVTFKSFLEAKRHENIHTFKSPFQCHLCNISFQKLLSLKMHMEVHKLVSQYKCKDCNLQFTNPNERDCKRALRNHKIKSCLYCGNQLPIIVYNMNFVRESYSS